MKVAEYYRNYPTKALSKIREKYNLDPFEHIHFEPETVTLDGEYTLDQLQEIIKIYSEFQELAKSESEILTDDQ